VQTSEIHHGTKSHTYQIRWWTNTAIFDSRQAIFELLNP